MTQSPRSIYPAKVRRGTQERQSSRVLHVYSVCNRPVLRLYRKPRVHVSEQWAHGYMYGGIHTCSMRLNAGE